MQRTLLKNRQEFWYSTHEGTVPIKSPQGFEKGEKAVRNNPIQAFANISAARGDSEAAIFGISLQYDKSMVFAKGEYPIEETTVLFVDRMPIFKSDGTTDTKHDYVVTRIAASLNYTFVAMSKVNVS